MPLTLRRLFGNYVSLIGAIIAGISMLTNAFLLILDFMAPRHNPYVGIITYMVLPGIVMAGLGLVIVGAAVRYSRLRRGLQIVELPRLDLNDVRHRTGLAMTFVVAIALLGFSAIGGYQAYHFSDSVDFCGQACHTVMHPEFTAYQNSPHARVPCVECHIGAGAEWFVRAKISGAYQVYSVLFNKFSRPIPTPIENLRPAQETCEQCHWPAKFWGRQLATRIHFGSDKANTRREIQLLVKTGGGSVKGLSEGIHWHMNILNKVWYLATDERRQVIPWVRLQEPDGRITEFVSTEHPVTLEQVRQAEIHRMDCMDCHNRPSHKYLPPGRALDVSLLAGRIPTDLPFIKKAAVEAMVQPYQSTAEAERGIETFIRDFYAKEYPQLLRTQAERLRIATAEVLQVYRQNFFPEMRVDWRAYPDNIGHKEFPGCFRCHDGKHRSASGRVIRRECETCHDFLERKKSGDLVLVAATAAFGHPWKLGGKHAEVQCGACHDGGPAKPASCRECHTIPAAGAPMTGMACKECHLKEERRQPLASCKSCHRAPAGVHRAATHAAAGCTACHAPHAWSPEPRKPCLTCHTDKAEHNPGPPCAECHDFRPAAAGARTSSATPPPAVTFPADPGSPGRVTFQHAAHLARGATCAACHPRLFKMQKGSGKLSMGEMAEGKACGTCHDGQKAFGVMDGDKCAACHKA